jgi:hypothetical protein
MPVRTNDERSNGRTFNCVDLYLGLGAARRFSTALISPAARPARLLQGAVISSLLRSRIARALEDKARPTADEPLDVPAALRALPQGWFGNDLLTLESHSARIALVFVSWHDPKPLNEKENAIARAIPRRFGAALPSAPVDSASEPAVSHDRMGMR